MTLSLAEKAAAWVESPEGQAALRKAAAEGKAMTDKLDAARAVDYRDLQKPMTI